jgi:hypothetical protein
MNSQQLDIRNGVEPVGGPQPVRTHRPFQILAKDFTSVEQGVPLRLLFGRARVAGTQIFPIFGFRNEATTTKQGK